ncbi:hypothetical protein DRN84_03580 [Candidatus Geothermarchaeota archaeon]|nr:MAG: hypothetical protein DRN84_03580 [Candidatus Geothermarchaeota archaeon]
MLDETLFLLLFAVVILLGYLGHMFFDKTKIPHFLLLIFIGVVLNVFNLLDKNFLIPIVGLFSTLTLIMVTFYSGLNLNIYDIIYQSGRAFAQSFIYIITSVILIGLTAHYILRWGLLESMIFSSMTGGEVTAAVIIPLAFSLSVNDKVRAILTLETAISTILTIILFFMFLNQWLAGSTEFYSILSAIIGNFTIALFVGGILSIITIKILHRFRKREYTYVLTIGMLLLIYTIVKMLGGNGELAALIFGLMLSNYKLVSKALNIESSLNISLLIYKLDEIQNEISFLFETLFFVFLGMVFTINIDTIVENLFIALIFTLILIVTRYFAVSLANKGSEVYGDRMTITILCAQGIVPASLSIYLLRYNLPLKYTFMTLITCIIILTNLVTTIGVWLISRGRY